MPCTEFVEKKYSEFVEKRVFKILLTVGTFELCSRLVSTKKMKKKTNFECDTFASNQKPKKTFKDNILNVYEFISYFNSCWQHTNFISHFNKYSD